MPEHREEMFRGMLCAPTLCPGEVGQQRAGPTSGLPLFSALRAYAEEDRYGVTTFMPTPSLTMTA